MRWLGWHGHCDTVLDHCWPSDNDTSRGSSAWVDPGSLTCGDAGGWMSGVDSVDHWVSWVGLSMRFHHVAQNSFQFKTHKLFISGIFHLVILDCSWTGKRRHRWGWGWGLAILWNNQQTLAPIYSLTVKRQLVLPPCFQQLFKLLIREMKSAISFLSLIIGEKIKGRNEKWDCSYR